MQGSTLLIIVVLLAAFGYWIGRGRSVTVAQPLGGIKHLHSLPGYYGWMTAFWVGLPAILVLGLWAAFDDSIMNQMTLATLPAEYQELNEAETSLVLNEIKNVVSGAVLDSKQELVDAANYYISLVGTSQTLSSVLVIALALLGASVGLLRIKPEIRARNHFEVVIRALFLGSSLIAIFTTIGIVLSVLFEAMRFFQSVPIFDFLFGLEWSPQIAIRADQQGSSGAFGAVPLFAGTMLISAIAMAVAVPIGLMSAIYLSEYASIKVRNIAKPVLEVLAGIPTVVYGFFAALTAAPFIRETFTSLGMNATSESALAAGAVMGIMIIPFVSSLSDDAIRAVPQSLRDGSYGLGATRSETIKQVIIPAALPGIVGGVLLAVSRAIGETMIVVMAAGLAANLTANPLESVTTVTVQIVTLLVGDQEFDSPKTLAAFALGLMLFVTTLALNFVALHVVKKYREQYD